MRTIIRFLITFKTLFLFLFLEIVSLLLVVNYNQFQKTVFLNSSNVVVGSIYNISNSIYEYFGLKSVNLKLADENAQLRDKLYMIDNELAELKRDTTFKQRNDQSEEKNYSFIPAKVINASVNKYRNFITLNKGALDGVKTEMGVINEDGVIGIVSSTSDHFSVVIPILNPSSRISAKINNKSQTGSLLCG